MIDLLLDPWFYMFLAAGIVAAVVYRSHQSWMKTQIKRHHFNWEDFLIMGPFVVLFLLVIIVGPILLANEIDVCMNTGLSFMQCMAEL